MRMQVLLRPDSEIWQWQYMDALRYKRHDVTITKKYSVVLANGATTKRKTRKGGGPEQRKEGDPHCDPNVRREKMAFLRTAVRPLSSGVLRGTPAGIGWRAGRLGGAVHLDLFKAVRHVLAIEEHLFARH